LGNYSAGVNGTATIADAGETVTIKLIDIASQQMISDLDVRF
jgi:hypothetical protein